MGRSFSTFALRRRKKRAHGSYIPEKQPGNAGAWLMPGDSYEIKRLAGSHGLRAGDLGMG